MKKWNLLLIGLCFSSVALDAAATPICEKIAANTSFTLWDTTCQAIHIYSPTIYRPDFMTDLHLIPMQHDTGGCGGPHYLRGTDDHGNQLFGADEFGGALLPTASEDFPSGYPKGMTTINVKTRDKIGNIQSCAYTFNRINDTLEICTVDENPDYCDLDKDGVLLIGPISAEEKKAIRENAHKFVEKVHAPLQKKLIINK